MSEEQAKKVVAGWLKVDVQPLGMIFGQEVMKSETFLGDNGQPIYYVLYLQPSGFVVVPADDLVEPIIAFVADGIYDPSEDNPLGALVSRDLTGRVAAAQGLQSPAGTQSLKKDLTEQQTAFGRVGIRAQAKWAELQDYADTVRAMGVSEISDVWVAPLVQSKWNQSTESGLSCYNYYTPPYGPNTPGNYPCGCVATAMAQLMRFHEHPVTGIGIHDFIIEVDDSPEIAWTRGGDGGGGAYDWPQMMLDPNSSITPTQRQAIGSLCYDAGISVNMQYTSSSSGADVLVTKDVLTNTFNYGNAVKGYNGGNNLGTALNDMVNPNLDCNHPVILGITGTSGGHAIIADGYGYHFSSLYHHLNMGWSGSDDVWYNLPDINSSPSFTLVYKCVYNIFVSGSGEIISGRVEDVNGEPISEVTVTAQGPGDPNSTVTDSKGIYSFANVSSGSTYTINVTKNGYTFEPPRTITTGISGGSTAGNRWGIDFQGISGEYPVIQTTPEEIVFSTTVGGSNPESQILSIRNSGFGTLNWVIDYDCNWLDVDAYEGISTGDINEVVLSVDISGLNQGDYNCELIISDPCALNHPKTVQVNLTISDVLLVPTEEYPTIQAAIDDAVNGGTVIVADGTYTGAGNRDIDFKGLAITVRSENGPENCIIDCEASSSNMHRGFDFQSGEGQASILDGFTIINGYALNDEGGGISCIGASPTINNCIISGCTAGNIGTGLYNYGGGMSNKDSSSPALNNCTFSGNSAQYGGGLHNRDSSPTLINCTFSSNSARYAGAMYNYDSSTTMTNCTFTENSAYYAGGIYIRAGSNVTLTNCTFTDNFGESKGGGLYNKGVATLTYCTFTDNTGRYRGGGVNNEGTSTLTNCTFSGNSASKSNGNGGGISTIGGSSILKTCTFNGNSATFYGGGVYCKSANHTMINCTFTKNSVGRHGRALATSSACQVQLTNCILWDGGDEIYELPGWDPSTIPVTYSDVQGGRSGTGNKNVNPAFVDPTNDDYHLQWDSLCINVGNPSFTAEPNETDIDGEPRIITGRVDMGADEVGEKQADFTRNGIIDMADLKLFVGCWLSSPGEDDWYILCDLYQDGQIDFADWAEFTKDWLWQVSWYEP